MTDAEFDLALIGAAFRLAAEEGWNRVTAAAAARAAGLPLAEARARFPSRSAILLGFGRLADQEALTDAPSDGSVRDQLFDLLMRRFDVLQAHRAGVKALLRALPTDPATALLLASASRRSMRWMLQGAGLEATGQRGELQVQGLMTVWLWAVRAWDRDDSDDLSGTMAAVDTALQRAERLASWLHWQSAAPQPPLTEQDGTGLDPSGPPADFGVAGSPDAAAPPDGNPESSANGAGELDPSRPAPTRDPSPPKADP
jgi:ubiquinone biosynthesis protein COQ9